MCRVLVGFLNQLKQEDGMRSYIGTKIILAEEMTYAQFQERYPGRIIGVQSETVPNSGYLVKYPDGYVSWSPANVFEQSYRLVSDEERASIV